MNMQENKKISAYRQQVREKVILTAIKAFTKKGIRQVTMDEVAKELSISKRTLYELFVTKENLLYECVERFYNDRMAQMDVQARHASNAMEILFKAYKMKVNEFRHTNSQFYADLIKYPQVSQFLDEQKVLMRGKIQKFIERGVKEGFFRKDVNYEIAGHVFDALGDYVVSRQLYRHYGIEEIFHNLIFVSLRGLCTDKGIKAIDKMI